MDFDDETHTLLGKVCDFVCGAESPPAPQPTAYMERGLAGERFTTNRTIYFWSHIYIITITLPTSKCLNVFPLRAVVMMQYQHQMSAEVCAGGKAAGTEHMIKPEVPP